MSNDVVKFVSGSIYKHGTMISYADKLGNTGKANPKIEHNIVVAQSGLLDIRFDDTGGSGNYYSA